ncbi:ABC transporter substrate-binding protein [Inquilinus sp. CAU 1745]|uniref:MlaC/ttg2D family ABC transporter substrate-binding protein n=1 Tax=Inquilinus sp. CAU 1745 TaxID=3140369 RepID=UPI00325B53C7
MKKLAKIAALLLMVSAAPAAAADDQGARDFIAELGDQTIEILRQPDLDAEQSVAQFREVFREGFDVPTVARFVLGRYWNVATPEQQQEYLQLFEQMVLETYARRFVEYSGETFTVTGARPAGESDVMVESRIVRPDGPPVNVAWRVREREDGFQIIDVVVEGVSMSVTQRNEFASVIQRNGGQVEALLQAMRNQIAHARAG